MIQVTTHCYHSYIVEFTSLFFEQCKTMLFVNECKQHESEGGLMIVAMYIKATYLFLMDDQMVVKFSVFFGPARWRYDRPICLVFSFVCIIVTCVSVEC